MDPEEEDGYAEDGYAEDGYEDDEPARNRFAEALTVFGIAFPFAVVLVVALTAVFAAIVYGVIVLLIRTFLSGYGG